MDRPREYGARIALTRTLVEFNETGVHCRIAGQSCGYRQDSFRPVNFRQHFRLRHPKEAAEKGMDDRKRETMIKIQRPKNGTLNLSRSITRMVNDHVTRYESGVIRCSIAAEWCPFTQDKMKSFNFVRHFIREHPKEAQENGFLKETTSKPDNVEDKSPRKSGTVSEFIAKQGTGFFCRIDPDVTCSYIQVNNVSTYYFARHFRQEHPALAKKYGFFKGFGQETTSSKVQPLHSAEGALDLYTRVLKHVSIHSGRTHCKITDQRCKYSQMIFKATLFRRHFCMRHPVEAMAQGFYEGFRRSEHKPQEEDRPSSPDSFDPKFYRKKSKRELVEENVMINEQGVHCRISDKFCKYIQLSFSAENFVRHFRIVHASEAIQKGLMSKVPRAKRKARKRARSTSVDSSSSVEAVESAPEEPLLLLDPGDEFDDLLWLEAPSTNSSGYCRLCFSVALPLDPIFNGPNDAASETANLIEECTSIRLTAAEDYAATICQECSLKLDEIKRFRMQCETLNRVVCRNRQTEQPKTLEQPPVSPSPPPPPSPPPQNVILPPKSPPPLVPLSAPVIIETQAQSLDNSSTPLIESDVVELSDSESGDDVEFCEPSTATTVVEEPEEDEPFIALQDDWFCCKLCNQIYHTFEVMVDHLQNNHSEQGFYINQQAEANRQATAKKPRRKGRRSTVATFLAQEVLVNNVPYYKCNDCDTILQHKRNLSRHWATYHGGDKLLEKAKIFCYVDGCSQVFMDNKSLTRHLKLQHDSCTNFDPKTTVV